MNYSRDYYDIQKRWSSYTKLMHSLIFIFLLSESRVCKTSLTLILLNSLTKFAFIHHFQIKYKSIYRSVNVLLTIKLHSVNWSESFFLFHLFRNHRSSSLVKLKRLWETSSFCLRLKDMYKFIQNLRESQKFFIINFINWQNTTRFRHDAVTLFKLQ